MRAVIIFATVLLTSALLAQTETDYILQGKAKLATAVNSWDEGNMLEARAFLERVLEMSESKWLLRYYIGYCDYRLSTHAFSLDDNRAARRYVGDGLEHLKECVALNPDFGDALALMSSLYGYKIAMYPWLGFIYGPKTGRLMGAALTLSPNSPQVHLLQGISQLYTPPAFGGGQEAAHRSLERSVELFAAPVTDPTLPEWGHSEAYGWLGLSALEAGDTTSARQHFYQALAIDSTNNWVRHELLPLLKEEESP